MVDRLQAVRAFLEDDPSDPFLRFALASELQKRGDLEEALAAFQTLATDRPDYVGTWYHLGKLYERLGRPEEAESTYRSGIAIAREQHDRHAESELRSALMELELED